ncbi:NADH-ubiquinone oxidoreductase chain J [Minicystis rosea]|nr:NADH-ubiquinone oxidoreductase chain J [Minicystis rosea]
MNTLELLFFGICTLFALVGGIATVAARNPIRGAMGLLSTIVGIAGMYLLLSAEFLAAIQIMVYAGAVVVLFLFVIMLLGSSATGEGDTRGWSSRYLGAGLFVLGSAVALFLLKGVSTGVTAMPKASPALGTVEGVGRELYTVGIAPFEIASALLLVAVVGAIAVARGRQVDPTMLPAKTKAPEADGNAAKSPVLAKESAS